MPHHVLRDRHLVVVLAIVNLKLEAHKVGQNGRRAGLCSDGGHFVVGALGPDDGEAVTVATYVSELGLVLLSRGGSGCLTGRGLGL